MAFEGQQPLKVIGALSGADLSAASTQYKFVKFSTTTSKRVALCAATTDIPCGVLQAPAPTSALDQPLEVVALGETKVLDDGTTQYGQIVGTDGSGRATPALTTMYPVGRIVAAAGSANGFSTAMVNCIAPTVKA
jgi:hypothetical protein